MRVAVVGAGGVGGLVGGLLAHAGLEVAFVARGAQLAALRERGLRVDSPRAAFHLPRVEAAEDPGALAPADVVLVAVKGWQVREVASRLTALCKPDGFALPLENGVEAASALARALGDARVVGGLCHLFAWLDEPGVVKHAGELLRITVGERQGGASERLERLAGAPRAGRRRAVARADPRPLALGDGGDGGRRARPRGAPRRRRGGEGAPPHRRGRSGIHRLHAPRSRGWPTVGAARSARRGGAPRRRGRGGGAGSPRPARGAASAGNGRARRSARPLCRPMGSEETRISGAALAWGPQGLTGCIDVFLLLYLEWGTAPAGAARDVRQERGGERKSAAHAARRITSLRSRLREPARADAARRRRGAPHPDEWRGGSAARPRGHPGGTRRRAPRAVLAVARAGG